MTYWRSEDVRARFIEFFAQHKGAEHTIVPSSPVVPHDDPTLLFANAGMNQFKPAFLGRVEPGSPLEGLKRAVNSQKCIRAGGKHNDLEDVGKDTYHHTFFEMLGNWSFGDYFKTEAIAWAWELLTDVYKLPRDRLYATYFGGDEALGLGPDTEAKDLWESFLPPERVLPFGSKDNFWEMGDTGPCGPCSEIHFDRIGNRDASVFVNADDPNVIEIWNLVFIQYDRQSDGTLKELPAKHVDTGMGLERLTSVLQHTASNYDTDLFTPLFEAISRVTHAPHEYRGRLGAVDEGQVDMAYRVIADHLRTLSFAIADGAVPSNDGRGYVLRRVLRRAVRFGHQMLDAPTGFFSRLVPTLAEHMGGVYPELVQHQSKIVDVLKEEEESFGRTLDRGIKLFEEVATDKLVAGEDAFKLYDTFGFPIDLTQLMAEERGLTVDTEGFERCMEAQRERSRAGSTSAASDDLTLDPEAMARLAGMHIKPTNDADKHHARTIRGRVKAIWNGRNFDEHADAGNTTKRIGLILDKTNFYAEAGGQVADHGRMNVTREQRSSARDDDRRHAHGTHGGEFRVDDVRSFGGYVLHMGLVSRGELRVGDEVELHVDRTRRGPTMANHTATHLLNKALRDVVGEHVEQKGSLVDAERLRFDFSNNGPVSPEQLAEVESRVRKMIDDDLPVHADLAPQYVARSIKGLRAVFGEKYPDPVRVVAVGASVDDVIKSPEEDRWGDCSIEFCGGTHLGRTGEAKAFALVSETGIAKGVRRIEALTGVPAEAAIVAAEMLERQIQEAGTRHDHTLARDVAALSANVDSMTLPAGRRAELRQRIAELHERVKKTEKNAAAARRDLAVAEARQLAASATNSPDPVFVSTIDAGADRQALQAAAAVLSQALPKSAVMLLSTDESDPSKPQVAILASVPKELVARGVKAGEWVGAVAPLVGGKGGGKPEQAQGGGTEPEKVREAVQAARSWAMKKVTS